MQVALDSQERNLQARDGQCLVSTEGLDYRSGWKPLYSAVNIINLLSLLSYIHINIQIVIKDYLSSVSPIPVICTPSISSR